ncbi:MAG: MAPEG family protein [Alphaproteobacteria bacterium]|nr:MAPEG family protein [Alphaproteobacteria bacterium]
MSIEAIMLPMFTQVALTLVLLYWMGYLRIRSIRTGKVKADQIALREPNWPLRVTQIGNAYHNQLELPVLFYVVMLLALITNTLDVVIYMLAWMFVLSRVLHAYIHVTSNRLDRRGGLFMVGAVALTLMWVIVIARIYLFPSL